MTNQSRVKAGVPAGGEFAANAHAEPAVVLGLPIDNDGLTAPAVQAAALEMITRRGEQLPDLGDDLRVVMASNPPATPASVLESAVGTDKDPRNIPWPEVPADAQVEVFVDPDDLCSIMDSGSWNDSTGYVEVYASIDLIANRDCDFWGIDKDGNEHVIVLGVHDYEEAVDVYDHANLKYREGFSDPMPAYNAAREDVKARRLEASTALLTDAGITVEIEDLKRRHYRLKRDGTLGLQLEAAGYSTKIIETRNWRLAGDDDFDAFLGGPTGEQERALLTLATNLVANDLNQKAHAAQRA